MTLLVDTHCHLDHKRFEGEQESIVERARKAGVTHLLSIGCATTPDSVASAVRVAERFPSAVRATVGVHPHDATALDDDLAAALEQCAEHPLVRAIGEMGLDYYYTHSPKAVQREAFRRQIAIARRVKKPIVVHTRSAPEETLALLEEEQARDVGGVIHCFSEDPVFAKRALALGFVASFSGLVTFERGADAIRAAAIAQPADAILVETDAPFLAPVPHRGTRNEPAFVRHTAHTIASLRGVDAEAFMAESSENAFRILGHW